jgi:hypothetical protein
MNSERVLQNRWDESLRWKRGGPNLLSLEAVETNNDSQDKIEL